MENDLYLKIEELKNKIINSEDYIEFKKLDSMLNDDKNVHFSYIKLDEARKDYEILSKNISADKNELEKKQSEYLKRKEEFYNIELVKQYREKYQKIKELYEFINENLIYIFDKKIF